MIKRMKAGSRRGASTVELLLVFCLVILFGITMVTLVVAGGDVYQRIVERKQVEGDARIAINYVNVLIRQSDTAGGVRIEEVDISDRDGLALTVEGDVADYTRWIYFYEGALWECIAAQGEQPSLDMSQKIIDVEDYSVHWDEQHSTVVQTVGYTSGAQVHTLRMSVMLRSQP